MMQCFFPKQNTFNLSVMLLDDVEKVFKIPVNQRASSILSDVAKCIAVTYIEYFGLKYFDRFQKSYWINPDKSLYRQLKKSQIEKQTNPKEKSIVRYQVFFEVRYYPRDPTSINDEYFRYQIFLQIRKDLASNKLAIKDDKISSVLCALILQSDFGDYDSERFAPHYIRQTIPSILLTQGMEDQIKAEHIKLRGIEPATAEYAFLEKIRWLENYGTIVFPVKDSSNKNCYLGLNPQGFALRYYKEATRKCDIFWPRISVIKRTGRQLLIKEKSEKTISHRFETGEKYLCKTLHKLSLEHFAFFKMKKDEKPLVKEPTKRTCNRNSMKEMGYSSDTSDNNQYSDDTFSSYQDSINTIQSAKISKVFKKTATPIRNCASDAEEVAFSRKNRRVIVCKYLTETEEENKTDTEEYIHQYQSKITPAVSHDRIPADYIYENRIDNPQDIGQIRQKRLTKKISNTTATERKFHGHKELEPFFSKTITEPPLGDGKYQIPFKSVRTRESGYQVTRARSGDGIENKARIRRKLPPTGRSLNVPQAMQFNESNSVERRIKESLSVDGMMSLRPNPSPSSPSKRLLPNILSPSPVVYSTPPIPKHRPPTFERSNLNQLNRPQSLFTEEVLKPAFQNVPPRLTQRTVYNRRSSTDGPNANFCSTLTEEGPQKPSKYNLNMVRRSIQETGI